MTIVPFGAIRTAGPNRSRDAVMLSWTVISDRERAGDRLGTVSVESSVPECRAGRVFGGDRTGLEEIRREGLGPMIEPVGPMMPSTSRG